MGWNWGKVTEKVMCQAPSLPKSAHRHPQRSPSWCWNLWPPRVAKGSEAKLFHFQIPKRFQFTPHAAVMRGGGSCKQGAILMFKYAPFPDPFSCKHPLVIPTRHNGPLEYSGSRKGRKKLVDFRGS